MARFSLNRLPKKERIRLIGEFYDSISLLKNRKEVALALRDLLDPDEIGNVMRRLDVAILLLLGFSYEEIVELLGVGKNKIQRVQHKLQTSRGGYKTLVKRLLEKRKGRRISEIKRQKRNRRGLMDGEVEYLKRKYPLHFLLWNIIDELGDHFYASSVVSDEKEEAKRYYSRPQNRRLSNGGKDEGGGGR